MARTRDFGAWYNQMPGADDPRLHVAGVVELTSSSHTAHLEFRPDGIVDEADLVTLALVVSKPDIGDDRMSDKEVSWAENVGPDIKRVHIRVPDGKDVSLDVTIAR